MAENLSGFPKTKVTLKDFSSLLPNNVQGVYCVQGVTMRGKHNKPNFVGDVTEYAEKFGGLHPTNNDALFFIRALEAGAKLYVNRIGHYTDKDDASTLVGTLASGTKALAVAETVTGVNQGTKTFTLATVKWIPALAVGVTFAITGSTNIDGTYTVVSVVENGTETNVVVSETIPGATPDGTATLNQTVVWKAESVGSGYDGSVVTIKASQSNVPGELDITIVLPNSGGNILEYKQVPNKMTTDAIASWNTKFTGLVIDSITNTIPVGTVTLTGGVEDITLLADTDFAGSPISKIGWNAFDVVTNSMRIFNLTKPVPAVDIALEAYVRGRGDMRGYIRPPIGLTPTAWQQYRMGTGIYTHTPIDSYFISLICGDINVPKPSDLTQNVDITALADVVGVMAKSDNSYGEWISAAGPQRGKLLNNNGVIHNLYTQPALADQIYPDGINAVIEHDSFGVVYWGNRTLLRDRTKLTSKANIADLAIVLVRNLKPIMEKQQFDPNDTQMWSTIYRNVRPYIVDVLEAGRAIRKGEGVNWFWFGDQFAKTIDDVKFNKRADLDAGKYRVRFVFVPIPATEYMGLEAVMTDSGTVKNFELISNPDIQV